MNFEDKPQTVGEAMELTMNQRFELEKMNRAIDSCNDINELKSLTKTMVSAWMTQKAAIAWMIREQIKNVSHPK